MLTDSIVLFIAFMIYLFDAKYDQEYNIQLYCHSYWKILLTVTFTVIQEMHNHKSLDSRFIISIITQESLLSWDESRVR